MWRHVRCASNLFNFCLSESTGWGSQIIRDSFCEAYYFQAPSVAWLCVLKKYKEVGTRRTPAEPLASFKINSSVATKCFFFR